MLKLVGTYASLDELSAATVPKSIQLPAPMDVAGPMTEVEALSTLQKIADKNKARTRD